MFFLKYVANSAPLPLQNFLEQSPLIVLLFKFIVIPTLDNNVEFEIGKIESANDLKEGQI